MGSAPASLADNPFLITLLLEMQTTIFLRTEMSRKTEYVHNPCFLSANILKILGVFAENQKKFLSINGDLYREFHPEKAKLIKDPIKYPIETQIFSSVFTEKLIEEAIKSRYNIIIEGTMRNPDVPLKTAKMFKDAGFRVEAYIIAAPKEFTQLGLYNRYQEEVLSKGQGRLADIDSHNKAVNGLMKSANQLYSDKAVDKISIHTYLAKERIKDFNLVNGEWSCKSMPSIFIDESRAKQMKNKEILKTNIQTGKELIESVTNPEVKKGMKEALSQLQSSLEKVQRQEKGLKKGFF